MSTVTQKLAQAGGRPIFICDFSPPRGADLSTIDQVKEVGADFVCVAYSPGRSVRVDSTVMAHLIAQGRGSMPPPSGGGEERVAREGGQEVIFNLACRDMNRLAIQNHLLGAQLLGLENVVVLQGDAFTDEDRGSIRGVNDYQPSELIRDIARLNRGEDFRGGKLRSPTAFCIGAVMDFSRGLEQEARSSHGKVEAGADFFLAQTFYQVGLARQFHEAYHRHAGQPFPRPIFYGLPIPAQGGILFGDVPEQVRGDLEKGRPGVDIALEQARVFLAAGLRTIYLVPPILRSGRRDYGAARDVLRALRT
ncbi:MAG: methylenetetrahydrofolate reductase [Chloroflexi bacterium]|nr:methylenetetrahydrofolate reductase [Chloroflexota bacterium]